MKGVPSLKGQLEFWSHNFCKASMAFQMWCAQTDMCHCCYTPGVMYAGILNSPLFWCTWPENTVKGNWPHWFLGPILSGINRLTEEAAIFIAIWSLSLNSRDQLTNSARLFPRSTHCFKLLILHKQYTWFKGALILYWTLQTWGFAIIRFDEKWLKSEQQRWAPKGNALIVHISHNAT